MIALSQRSIALGLLMVFMASTAWGQSVRDSKPSATDLTSDDIVKIMGAYDRDEDDPAVLQTWLQQLRSLIVDVDRSEQMTPREKRRRARFIEQRIKTFERRLGDEEIRADEVAPGQSIVNRSPGDQGVVQPPARYPLGWRDTRSWYGRGLLPGGSWQGSAHQEVWGITSQPAQNQAADSDRRYGSQSSTSNLPLNSSMPVFNWPPGSSPIPMPSVNGQLPAIGTNGGVMMGGGASARSSRSSSSGSIRRSGSQ